MLANPTQRGAAVADPLRRLSVLSFDFFPDLRRMVFPARGAPGLDAIVEPRRAVTGFTGTAAAARRFAVRHLVMNVLAQENFLG